MNEELIKEVIERFDGVSLLAFQAAKAQATIEPIFAVLTGGMVACFAGAAYWLAMKAHRANGLSDQETGYAMLSMAFTICGALTFLVFTFNIQSAITAVLNPDWWALQHVVGLTRGK